MGKYFKNGIRLPTIILFSCLALTVLSSCETMRLGTDILAGRDRDRNLIIPPPVWQNLVPAIGSESNAPLRVTSGRIANPPLAFWAVMVNLDSPDLQILVGPDPIEYGTVPAIRVSSFAGQYDCAVAINANPFDRVSDREGEPRRIVGLAVQEGFLLSDPEPRYGALLIKKDRTAHIVDQKALLRSDGTLDHAALEPVLYAVGGFFPVLQDGIPLSGRKTRSPRSAVGVSRDGRTLFLLAIDGRLLDSVGTTEHETGQILAALGAWDGLILDGGGSTSLVIREKDGTLAILNHPVHEGTLNRERAVATCLGFRITGSP